MLSDWINPKFLSENKISEMAKEFISAEPFQYLSLNDFLNEKKANELFDEIKKEKYYKEENDLYSFSRTFDFKNSKSKLIQEFRVFLLSDETLKFFEKFLGKGIDSKRIDLHSLKLENTDYLLCHDDLVEGRYFAFIFNLSKNILENDGGKLELLDEEKGEAKSVVKSISPKFNQFNVFKVSNSSFHQVSEVLVDKERISISGWFYKKMKSKEENLDLKINRIYLNKEVLIEMQEVFEEEAFIQLNNFFENDMKEIKDIILKEKFILDYKPQFHKFEKFEIKNCYKPEIIKLYEFFKSKKFLEFLEGILQFELNIKSINLSKYSHGDFTLLNDKMKREDIIEVFYDLSSKFEDNMGGTLTYLTKEEEIYYFQASFNTLTIFFKPSEVMKYLKYINNRVLNSEKSKDGKKMKDRSILRFEIEIDCEEF